ncbi:MAG: metallophosphoesterase family protein [Phycisphaerales bacterium]|jgi:predicted phosphodiesterase|nr:metallophosphoesterase family protein [Phycisphaerales bacterium]MBT7171470.1 metallophosphoesterase family protein [Phycisphaerales bacterium]
MIAILSDIHSNTAALSAVLDDIREQRIRTIWCLGDILGYGPNPRECLAMIRDNCAEVILGNHDYAVLYEPTYFNAGAESAAFWTRQMLCDESVPEESGDLLRFLATLENRKTIANPVEGVREVLLVHGSPRRPVNEYLFPEDTTNHPAKIQSSFDRMEHLCFVGHTHMPGVFCEDLMFHPAAALPEGIFELNDKRHIVNVGSVGQPRDRDNRACYVILEDHQVRFRRVKYDVETTADAIRNIESLDNYLADRLVEGR